MRSVSCTSAREQLINILVQYIRLVKVVSFMNILILMEVIEI